MGGSLFTPADVAAMFAVVDRIDAAPRADRIRALLASISVLTGANHAELSQWEVQHHCWIRSAVTVHDPGVLQPPWIVMSSSEVPAFAGATASDIRTWALDGTPVWGGPALLSARRGASRSLSLLAFRRVPGSAPFQPRKAAMLDALHRCDRIAALTTGLPPDVTDLALPLRARQVLVLLLDGRSEKEVASALTLSPHTIHVHIKDLYRRFGVCSRGELLSLWVHREPSPPRRVQSIGESDSRLRPEFATAISAVR